MNSPLNEVIYDREKQTCKNKFQYGMISINKDT